MIPRTADWKNALACAIREPAELLAFLELPRDLLPEARRAGQGFALRVPRGYAALMEKGNPHDPLLRQVLPLGAELLKAPGYSDDPVGDRAAAAAGGLLHKYAGRVLLVTTGACAIHCRYCFRRHFPYGEARGSVNQWQGALDYIASDRGIREVILSGGDPLLLDDQRLAALISRLEAIDHLERLRIHTRLPVVLPERVDDGLLEWLGRCRLQPVVVIHANHPRELGAAAVAALTAFRQAGATVLNQSVLLQGVNDQVDTLAALSESLFAAGVIPYYLHMLDAVEGAAHFAVGEKEAQRLHEALRRRLPGYLVPRLARELPGEPYKRIL